MLYADQIHVLSHGPDSIAYFQKDAIPAKHIAHSVAIQQTSEVLHEILNLTADC